MRFGTACAVRMLASDVEDSRRQSLSYLELRDRALRLAARLRAMGIGRGDRVVLFLPRGLDQYMAILGTLWSGAAYVPVDWGYPQERIDYIAEDSGAALTLTYAERADAMPGRTLALDAELGDLAAEPATPLDRKSTV